MSAPYPFHGLLPRSNPASSGSSGPWVDIAGVIQEVNPADNVVIGDTVMLGSEKLRVVGDTVIDDGALFLEELAANPAPVADHGGIFTKEVLGVTELFYIDSAGNVIQITSGGTIDTDIAIPDNNPTAFRIHQALNNYVLIDTTNNAEKMTFGDATAGHVTPTFKFVTSTTLDPAVGDSFAVLDQNGEYYISMDSTTGNEIVYLGSRTAPGLASIDCSMSDNYNRSFTVYQLSAGPTRNDYIVCDSTNGTERTTIGNTGATRPALTIQLPDNLSTALQVRENTNDYISCDTTNAAERTTIGNTGATRPALTIQLPDNLSTALQIRESTNDYLVGDTTDGAERLNYGNTTANAPRHAIFLRDNISPALQMVEGANAYLTIVTTDTAEAITLGNTLTSLTLTMKDNGATAFRLIEGANVYISAVTTNGSETIGIGNSLTAITETVKDNTANAYRVVEGANVYMSITTTDTAETIGIGNSLVSTTLTVKDNAANVFRIVEGANVYMSITTTDTAETLGIGNSLTAITETVKDNSATAYQVVEGANAYIVLSTTNAAERITFGNTGATTANYTFQIPDNVTTAFQIKEGANSYLTVLSTNNNERVRIDSNAYLGLVARGSAAAAATNEGALYTFIVGGNTDLHYREPNTGSIMQLTAGGENYVSNAIQIPERGADPASVANAGKVYTKDVSTITELFWINSSGTVVQITSGASLNRDILIPDNTVTAYRIREAGNDYMVFTTSNAAEVLTFGNSTQRQQVDFNTSQFRILGPQGAGVFQVQDNGAAVFFKIDTTLAARLITYGRNNGGTVAHSLFMKNSTSAISWTIGGGDEILNVNGTTGSEAFLWGNTTANCPTHTFDLRDNKASALLIQEGTNAYLTCTTTNTAEVMTYGNATASAPQHVFNLRDNLAEALIIQEGANKYIVCTTTNTTEQVIIAASPAGCDLSLGNATSTIGMYGAAGATLQTVTGSRGGNAALASLLTALAAVGIIVDGSSA